MVRKIKSHTTMRRFRGFDAWNARICEDVLLWIELRSAEVTWNLITKQRFCQTCVLSVSATEDSGTIAIVQCKVIGCKATALKNPDKMLATVAKLKSENSSDTK